MKKIIPITDLLRQAREVVGSVTSSHEAVIITQRGRAAAVLLSAARYAQIEEDLQRLDELELLEMISRSREARSKGQTLSHKQVKARLEKKQSQTRRQAR